MTQKATGKTLDIEMLRTLAESKGYPLYKLSKMYGRNRNYFNSHEMGRKEFKVRKPEYDFLMDVLNDRPYDEPMMVEKAVIAYWAKMKHVHISAICKAIERSVSYFSNKDEKPFLLYAGEVKIIRTMLGVSVDQLGMSIDEIKQKDNGNQYVTDLESLADKMKKEQKNPLADYSDEELLAEIKRRMEE